ncbi:MAG: alpha/beta fold hydrolase [Ferruginibacter sp.]
MKKKIFSLLKIAGVLYLVFCVTLYFFQEKLIFFPEKLNKNFKFNFNQHFEELNIPAKDGILLHGILFKADSTKGLIFYLHGNAGSIRNWGEVAKTYTDRQYDVFILDYRGYGKSEGTISSQQQLFDDVQAAYNELKKKYTEDKTVVLGYSVGTGLAAKLASANHPLMLILQAPYYSLADMMRQKFPVVPTIILKYKLPSNEFIRQCKMPIVIFHGNADEVIYYGSSLKLKQLFKNTDTLVTLKDQGHNGITENTEYQKSLRYFLK